MCAEKVRCLLLLWRCWHTIDLSSLADLRDAVMAAAEEFGVFETVKEVRLLLRNISIAGLC